MKKVKNNKLEELAVSGILQWNIAEEITGIKEQDSSSDDRDNEKSVLEQIFPPREWTNKGDKDLMRTWRQTISRDMPTRSGVGKMINTLKNFEQYYQIKSKGVDETRVALYSSYFGNMNLSTSINYMQSWPGIVELENEIENLEKANKELKVDCRLASQKYKHLLKKKQSGIDDYIEKLINRHEKQKAAIKTSTEQFEEQLMIMVQPNEVSDSK